MQPLTATLCMCLKLGVKLICALFVLVSGRLVCKKLTFDLMARFKKRLNKDDNVKITSVSVKERKC